MRRRGRPLARAAVVGGVAYSAGKSRANNQAQEADQNAQIADLQQQQYAQQAPPQQQYQAPPAAAPAAAPEQSAMVAELTQLKALLDAGVLTPAEFEAAKQKAIQGG